MRWRCCRAGWCSRRTDGARSLMPAILCFTAASLGVDGDSRFDRLRSLSDDYIGSIGALDAQGAKFVALPPAEAFLLADGRPWWHHCRRRAAGEWQWLSQAFQQAAGMGVDLGGNDTFCNTLVAADCVAVHEKRTGGLFWHCDECCASFLSLSFSPDSPASAVLFGALRKDMLLEEQAQRLRVGTAGPRLGRRAAALGACLLVAAMAAIGALLALSQARWRRSATTPPELLPPPPVPLELQDLKRRPRLAQPPRAAKRIAGYSPCPSEEWVEGEAGPCTCTPLL